MAAGAMDAGCGIVSSRIGSGGRDVGFLGEAVKGSANSSAWGIQLSRSFQAAKRMAKIKPGVAQSVMTTNNPTKTAPVQAPLYTRKKADPKNVAAIILGGGAGTQLFPLTTRRATPAVPVGGCYRLIDIPMSNCINSGINKIFVLTQFNSASLNRHISRTYFGNGVSFGDGFVDVLAATQTSGETGMNWFQGTADAVRQFTWVFEDAKNKNIENVLILAGDQIYRMDYMNFVQNHIDRNSDISVSCVPVGERSVSFLTYPMFMSLNCPSTC
uniref:Nucleotidyl transferase domain-containing protein n=1 Tax=Kalanchoe fedtschenkoi TaxID=63787 RepID=A0A7N0T7S4_KALFE